MTVKEMKQVWAATDDLAQEIYVTTGGHAMSKATQLIQDMIANAMTAGDWQRAHALGAVLDGDTKTDRGPVGPWLD